MISNVYSAVFEEISVSAAQDLITVIAGATDGFWILRAWLGNTTIETNEQIALSIHRTTTTGTGGAAVTPEKFDPRSEAFGGTARRNDTTRGTQTGSSLLPDGAANLSGWLWVPTPEERIWVEAGVTNRIVFGLESAPTAFNASGGLLIGT